MTTAASATQAIRRGGGSARTHRQVGCHGNGRRLKAPIVRLLCGCACAEPPPPTLGPCPGRSRRWQRRLDFSTRCGRKATACTQAGAPQHAPEISAAHACADATRGAPTSARAHLLLRLRGSCGLGGSGRATGRRSPSAKRAAEGSRCGRFNIARQRHSAACKSQRTGTNPSVCPWG